MLKATVLLAVFAASEAVVRINLRRCDRQQWQGDAAASACTEHFCPALGNDFTGYGVYFVSDAMDKFSACMECLDLRCEAGDSQYCTGTALRDSCRRSPPQPGDKVAVIGGGVSGIFAARRLKKQGYNVVVYEADSELAASTESIELDNHQYDFATKYVMPNTPTGEFQAEMAEIVAEYGMTLRAAVPSLSFLDDTHPTTPVIAPVPHILLPFLMTTESTQQFVTDLIIGHTLLAFMQNIGVREPNDLIKTGLILADESYGAWSARINAMTGMGGGFTTLMGFIHDGFLQGPTSEQPAAIVVNVRRNMLPPLIKQLLLGFGVFPNNPLLTNPPPTVNGGQPLTDLINLLSDPFTGSSWTFEEGMQELFDRIADRENIRVLKDSKVTNLRFVNDQVFVTARSRGSRSFDHVVIAVKPDDANKMLRNHPEMRNLYNQASGSEPVVSWAVRATPAPQFAPFPEYAAFLFPDAFSFPTDGSIIATNKDFADSDVTFAIGYLEDGMTRAQARDEMIADMTAAGYTNVDIVAGRAYDYPMALDVDDVANGWWDQAHALQGVGNVYYVGAVWSGENIPSLLDFVERYVPAWFPNSSANSGGSFSGLKQATETDLANVVNPEMAAGLSGIEVHPTGMYADLLNSLHTHGDGKTAVADPLAPAVAPAQED